MRDISESQKATENLLNVKAVVHDLSIVGEAKGIDIFEDPASEAFFVRGASASVPEPATIGLVLTGLGLAARRRRRV